MGLQNSPYNAKKNRCLLLAMSVYSITEILSHFWAKVKIFVVSTVAGYFRWNELSSRHLLMTDD